MSLCTCLYVINTCNLHNVSVLPPIKIFLELGLSVLRRCGSMCAYALCGGGKDIYVSEQLITSRCASSNIPYEHEEVPGTVCLDPV